jgi:hypothetical protein
MKYFLGFLLFLALPLVAQAADKPDVSTALTEWVAAVESGDAVKVVALYDKDAIFFSTFAVKPMKTQAERLGYYKKAVAEPDIKIDINESHPYIFGDVAINSGLYTFHYTQDGEPMTIPARFSFTYILQGGKWVIVEHHSSRVPGSDNKKDVQ